MKRIGFILAAIAVSIGFSFSPLLVSAEESATMPDISIESVVDEEVIGETESVENSAVLEDAIGDEIEGIIPETEGSKWFDKTIKPFLIEYGAVLLAVFTALILGCKKIKSVIRMFTDALEMLGIAHEKVENSSKDMEAIKEDNKAFQEEMRKSNEKWRKSVEKQLIEGVEDTNKTVHKILEVEELAYESNATLVGNGTAKKIAEVIRK